MDHSSSRRFLATLGASVLHLLIVGVLAPGLAYATMDLFGGPGLLLNRIATAPALGLMAALFAWPVGVPLAFLSLLMYALLRPVRIAPPRTHLVAWMAIGAVITLGFSRIVSEGEWTLLAFGCGGAAGIAIGALVWVTWRRVDAPRGGSITPSG